MTTNIEKTTFEMEHYVHYIGKPLAHISSETKNNHLINLEPGAYKIASFIFEIVIANNNHTYINEPFLYIKFDEYSNFLDFLNTQTGQLIPA